MFTAGISSASFSIPIIDDQVLENDESFTLHMAPLPVNVIVGDFSQATVTILNDDSKYHMLHVIHTYVRASNESIWYEIATI